MFSLLRKESFDTFQNGSVDCCAHLVNDPQGTSLINQLDASGKAAMHYAAAAGHCAVIRQLATVPGCDLESDDPDERLVAKQLRIDWLPYTIPQFQPKYYYFKV